MSAHDGLPRHKFGPVEFPGQTTRLRLEFRHHVHEYPHAPGGAPEKLGRALYRISVRVGFHATFPAYPGLYPDSMNQLRAYAELGTTLSLRHPTAGEFPAFITAWDQLKEARVRSGEVVDLEFLEDQSAQFALSDLTDAKHVTAAGISADQFAQALAKAQADNDIALSPSDLSLTDALQMAANDVLAVQDTALLYGNRYGAALSKVANIAIQVDHLESLQDARAWPVIDILRDLQATIIALQNDMHSRQAQLLTWTNPSTQSLIQIAISLYGDASKQSDLLTLNVIDDPMRVPAGSAIRYYPLTPQQIAAA